MPPCPLTDTSSGLIADAATCPQDETATRGVGDVPYIEYVRTPSGRRGDTWFSGPAPVSTWPHAYASPRPQPHNPYTSTHPRRPR